MSAKKHTNIYALDVLEAFLLKVSIVPGECWEWKSTLSKNGYGLFTWGSAHSNMRAHRWSYEFFHKDTLGEYYACHTCDNPKCVNPLHIYKGTPLQNSQDASKRKRFPYQQKTHCKWGHEFTKENTYIYQKEHRQCRSCRKRIYKEVAKLYPEKVKANAEKQKARKKTIVTIKEKV